MKYNKLPDKYVVDFVKGHNIKTACEFGCSKGRNAIYLAKNDVDTEEYDLSEIAIESAKKNAEENKTEKVVFKAKNIFKLDLIDKKFDLVINSGVFHHLTPHRHLQYRDICIKYISRKLTERYSCAIFIFSSAEYFLRLDIKTS